MSNSKPRGLLAIILVLGLAGSALAQSNETPGQGSRVKPKAEASAKIDTKTETILGLPWHPSLEGAIAANGREKKDQRPILFMRLLGDLRGKT